MHSRQSKNQWLLIGAIAVLVHLIVLLGIRMGSKAPPRPQTSVLIELGQAPSQVEVPVASPPVLIPPEPEPEPEVEPEPDPPEVEPAPEAPAQEAVEALDSEPPPPDIPPAPAPEPPPDAALDPAQARIADALRKAMATGPAARRERDLLLNPGGTGVVTGEALSRRVQGIATLDAEIVTARHRADMGVNHPHVGALSAAMRVNWDPSIPEVRSLGLPSMTRAEQGLSENIRGMLEMEAGGAIGGAGAPIAPGQGSMGQLLAAQGLAATQCTYDYYALGWYSILLTPDGELKDIQVYRSSGSAAVDRRVMAAVAQSSPFPEIPEGAQSQDGLFRGTWEFGFRDYSGSNCRLLGQGGEPFHVTVIAFRGNFY